MRKVSPRARLLPASMAWRAKTSRRRAKRRFLPLLQSWRLPHPMPRRVWRCSPIWPFISSAAVRISIARSLPLRRSLEADRFGFVAHALATRDGCTSDNCKALALLHDPSHVRANLSGQTLDRYLDRYLAAWAQSPDTPLADATSSSSAPGQPGAPGQRKVMVDIDFPTAASIPPVSIMNPEPPGPRAAAAVAAAVAGDPTAHDAQASSARRSRKPAANPPAQAAAFPSASEAPVDPVWTPGTTPAAPQPAATAASPTGAAPVQLNPFPTQPQASAGGAAARAQ